MRIPFPKYFVAALLLVLSTGTFAQSVNDKPEVQVSQVLACNTAFPDAMYNTVDWNAFPTSTLAQTTIDYHNVDYGLLNASVFYYTNKFRESRHLMPLKFAPELRDAAVFQSIEMVNHNFYAHINTHLPAMRDPVMRMKYFKFKPQASGENIAQEFFMEYTNGAGFTTEGEGKAMTYMFTDGKKRNVKIPLYTYASFAEHIVKQWINSPPHRENMLGKDFTHMGCGIFADQRTMTKKSIPAGYGTQDFGRAE